MHWSQHAHAPLLTFRALMGRPLDWLPATMPPWLCVAFTEWKSFAVGHSTGARGNGRIPLGTSACPDRNFSWDCIVVTRYSALRLHFVKAKVMLVRPEKAALLSHGRARF